MMSLPKITIDTYNQMVDMINDLQAENEHLERENTELKYDLKIMTEYKEALQKQLNKEDKK